MKGDVLRISFVLQDLYRLGAQYVTALVARGLARRGHDVEVVVSAVQTKIGRERPDLKPFELPPEVPLVVLPQLKASRNVLALARHFRAARPDVVIPMSSHYVPACALALALLPRGRRPLLVPVEHSGGIGMAREQSRVGHREGALSRLLQRWLRTRADAVVAVSQGVADALVETGRCPRERLHVIYNPVVDEQYLSKRSRPAAHPWLAQKTGPVIVAAGSHVPLKGYDVLLRAFAAARERWPCRLVLFGEGPLTPSLKALAQELGVAGEVSLPGHTDNLPAELARADAFAVSSHCESFSVVLVEALAARTPVVATDCPVGPREILQGGKFGVLVKSDDPQALAEGLLKVLSGEGIPPVPESWAPYTLDKIVGQYESVLGEVSGHGAIILR